MSAARRHLAAVPPLAATSTHGVYDDGQAVTARDRCPRCYGEARTRAAGDRWWCSTCDLVYAGTDAEHLAMAAERRQWVEGTHPAQQPAAPPVEAVHRPHDGAPCVQCGQPHASRPDPRAPRPLRGGTT